MRRTFDSKLVIVHETVRMEGSNPGEYKNDIETLVEIDYRFRSNPCIKFNKYNCSKNEALLVWHVPRTYPTIISPSISYRRNHDILEESDIFN